MVIVETSYPMIVQQITASENKRGKITQQQHSFVDDNVT
jgi:hypothetical protein